MRLIIIVCAVWCLTASFASAHFGYNPSQEQTVGLWPKPTSATHGDQTASLSTTFTFNIVSGSTKTMLQVAERYRRLILLHTPPTHKIVEPADVHASCSGRSQCHPRSAWTQCEVEVKSTTEVLTYAMDESYSLNVSSSSCKLSAATFVGAMYAMETFSQLVLSNGGSTSGLAPSDVQYWITGLPWSVVDMPRFGYRGLMVDTSRHFLPLNALKRQIDAMSYNKLNHLHWHMTDAQSTPFESSKYPELSKGAFRPGAVYTPADIAALVEYARVRAVQIVLEIDMPGHSFAFGIGYPDLIVNCSSMYPLETQFWTSSLDPTEANTYQFLEGLLEELIALVPGTLFHIGGDEVQQQCWNSSPKIQSYLKTHNMSNNDLYVKFEEQMIAVLGKLGRTSVTWDATFLNNVTLPEGAVVHQYERGEDLVTAIVKKGHKVIVSGLKGDYLASQAPWTDLFAQEIVPTTLSPGEESLIMGGEVCMWGETMDDSDIDTIVWPDAAAFAERLWSPGIAKDPAAHNTTEAILRLMPQRCRLYQRGIRSKPLDSRDIFGRRRLQAQCETLLPPATAESLAPLSAMLSEQ